MPSSGIIGSYGSSVPSVLRNLHTILQVAKSVSIPTNSIEGFPFSTCLQHLLFVDFFDYGHSDQCEVIPHCSFDLHFSNNEQC